jgi:hypothetical protein
VDVVLRHNLALNLAIILSYSRHILAIILDSCQVQETAALLEPIDQPTKLQKIPESKKIRLDISNISPDCTTIKICQKAWRGQLHDYLKSESGKREVDLHPTAAEMLEGFVGERNSGLPFCNRQNRAFLSD